MQTLRMIRKTGKDGMLSLQLPLGQPDIEYELVIVAQPATSSSEARGWPPGYFAATFGSITDDTFERQALLAGQQHGSMELKQSGLPGRG